MPAPIAPSDGPARAVSPELRAAILGWYAANGRELAFRGTVDPWAILVSEAMAQQTQAARAAEYWTRFLAEFPTVHALADATPAAVLRAWRGLGYNRRALALRAAAIAIVRDHGGLVPADLEALRRLPGVGPYTARAVAALAFGRPVGAVDVNVRRVLSRAVGGELGSMTAAELQAVADASVPPREPGTWTHALMDIGATFCGPRVPRCGPCPARPACAFAQDGAGEPAAGGLGAAGATRARAGTPPEAGRPPAAGTPTATRTRSAARTHGAAGTLDLARTRDAAGARDRARTQDPAGTAALVVRERQAPFESTSRWLRGRLLDLLRDAPGTAWAPIPAKLGPHDEVVIARALDGLAREGLAERHPHDRRLARLPIA